MVELRAAQEGNLRPPTLVRTRVAVGYLVAEVVHRQDGVVSLGADVAIIKIRRVAGRQAVSHRMIRNQPAVAVAVFPRFGSLGLERETRPGDGQPLVRLRTPVAKLEISPSVEQAQRGKRGVVMTHMAALQHATSFALGVRGDELVENPCHPHAVVVAQRWALFQQIPGGQDLHEVEIHIHAPRPAIRARLRPIMFIPCERHVAIHLSVQIVTGSRILESKPSHPAGHRSMPAAGKQSGGLFQYRVSLFLGRTLCHASRQLHLRRIQLVQVELG